MRIYEIITRNGKVDAEGWISEEHYENATGKDTVKFFRSLGGEEHVSRANTPYGRKVVRIKSVSPDKLSVTVREYEFVE